MLCWDPAKKPHEHPSSATDFRATIASRHPKLEFPFRTLQRGERARATSKSRWNRNGWQIYYRGGMHILLLSFESTFDNVSFSFGIPFEIALLRTVPCFELYFVRLHRRRKAPYANLVYIYIYMVPPPWGTHVFLNISNFKKYRESVCSCLSVMHNFLFGLLSSPICIQATSACNH